MNKFLNFLKPLKIRFYLLLLILNLLLILYLFEVSIEKKLFHYFKTLNELIYYFIFYLKMHYLTFFNFNHLTKYKNIQLSLFRNLYFNCLANKIYSS